MHPLHIAVAITNLLGARMDAFGQAQPVHERLLNEGGRCTGVDESQNIGLFDADLYVQ